MDWFKQFFKDPGTLVAIISSSIIGLVMGSANGIIQRKHGGWSGFFGAMATGTAVAVIVGLAVQDYIKVEALRLAVVGVCAVMADDIWAGLRTFGQGIKTDPLGAIARLIDALRGKVPDPASPVTTSTEADSTR